MHHRSDHLGSPVGNQPYADRIAVDFAGLSSGSRGMGGIDKARADIVRAIAHLEDAIEAAMPGQAPGTDVEEIRESIAAVRDEIEGALVDLTSAENRTAGLSGAEGS